MSDDPVEMMSADLVERLRKSERDYRPKGAIIGDGLRAADRIEALQGQLHAERIDHICALDRIEALEAELASVGDPNSTSVFEYMRDADGTVTACRTVTTTSWREL